MGFVKANGFFDRLFKLEQNATTVKTELAAGLTTFMTMAYILAVNPQILSAAGIPRGGVFVATALAAVVGTLLMAFFSNYPFVLVPGMGLNAFLAFTVVLTMGYSWQFALLAVFVEGLVFLALSLTPVREAIFNSIPFSLKKAVAAGIGLFICIIAMKTAGLVVDNPETLVSMVHFTDVPSETHGICAIIALVGTIFTGLLVVKKFKGAILLGILFSWMLGMVAQTLGIYVPDPANGFLSLYPHISVEGLSKDFGEFGSTLGALFRPEGWTHTVKGEVVGSGWSLAMSPDFIAVMFSFFFVDLFGALGSLIGISMKGEFLDKDDRLPRISGALCADSIATVAGAVFGTSTTTTYVESASGVMAGGRTGLTGAAAAALFARSLVFAPVFLAIPGFATAPALIVVGYMMPLVVRRHKLAGRRRGASGVPRRRGNAVHILHLGRLDAQRDRVHGNQRLGRALQAHPLDNVRPRGAFHRQIRADVKTPGRRRGRLRRRLAAAHRAS